MSFDKLNIVDKKTYKVSYFGEVQTEFNMSLTCDGTKESCKVEIFNNVRKPLEPFTIVQMEDTDTWWVVQKDKVQRYTNEIGGYYKHEISLFGAFELLNVRELTNCGFNANKYTIRQFLTRLFNLSSFEFTIPLSLNDLETYINLDEPITYLKTFQNYTLGSAIKELFAGMNLTPKLRFTTTTISGEKYISVPYLGCYSRSGNNQTTIDIESFDNAEEQSSFDGENFGTRVLSNVENCVSANVVRYPAIGGARLTSNEETINAENAILRLPSNVYSVNKVIIYLPLYLYKAGGGASSYYLLTYTNDSSLIEQINKIIEEHYPYLDILSSAEEEIVKEHIRTKYFFELKNGGVYNKIDDTRTGNWYVGRSSSGYDNYWALNSKQYADLSYGESPTHDTWKNIISWEQGKDFLENFNICNGNLFNVRNTQFREIHTALDDIYLGISTMGRNDRPLTIESSRIAVEYVPMSDLVVKTENDKDSNDTQLYNQNGKLVDSKAVSKLINSHTQEISSEEIVRYGTYYDFNDIPKPSTKVSFDNKTYIITNVSIDMHENDDDGYYMECMFTMTENVACKSTMVSANTNIRDYECPQQNNVKRIQTYRDYIELSYDHNNTHNETSYLPSLSRKLFDITTNNSFGFDTNYTCMFGTKLADGSRYYYQIGTTLFELNRQEIVVCDFKDNNIIGYEAGKSYWTFTIQQLKDIYNGNQKNINTPINYAYDDGTIEDLDLFFLNGNELTNVYNEYDANEICHFFVSVNSNLFTYMASNDEYTIHINEEGYKKDGLEVPVFEYCCEVGNTEGIEFGDDFLKQLKVNIGNMLIIAYHKDGNTKITQENWLSQIGGVGTYIVDVGVGGDNDNIVYLNYKNVQTTTKGKSIMVVAQYYDSVAQETKRRFLFALNNCKNEQTNVDGELLLLLGFNNYRLR